MCNVIKRPTRISVNIPRNVRTKGEFCWMPIDQTSLHRIGSSLTQITTNTKVEHKCVIDQIQYVHTRFDMTPISKISKEISGRFGIAWSSRSEGRRRQSWAVLHPSSVAPARGPIYGRVFTKRLFTWNRHYGSLISSNRCNQIIIRNFSRHSASVTRTHASFCNMNE